MLDVEIPTNLLEEEVSIHDAYCSVLVLAVPLRLLLQPERGRQRIDVGSEIGLEEEGDAVDRVSAARYRNKV